MRPHLRYLRYVLLHKLYVFRAGVAINGWRPWWVLRLLIHDWSKFRPSEWRPYVTHFYGPSAEAWQQRETERRTEAGRELPALVASDVRVAWGEEQQRRIASNVRVAWGEEQQRRLRAFNAAWLAHQHRNPHHWQHWLLREDSGKTLLLIPPVDLVDEMVADWLGAGAKVLTLPDFATCVAETIAWYVANRNVIQLREATRMRVHQILVALARSYGLSDAAIALHDAAEARRSITIGGP
jgi:hypothetical protein